MSHALSSLTQPLREGTDLTEAEAEEAAGLLTQEETPQEDKATFLKALAAKGESPDEVASFARCFRQWARDPELSDYAAEAIDIVGTGGDHSHTFNFSTATALFLASQKIPVMKHGNRSITSKSGSADLLATLGVPMEADNDFLRKSMEQFHFCFFFAPAFHPAFRTIMPVRRELAAEGTRTIFNILGPLINPGQPRHQLLGVFSREWMQPLAESLQRLELQAAMVVHCQVSPQQGVDEWTVAGKNLAAGVGRLSAREFPHDPGTYGLDAAPLEAIQGGNSQKNYEILMELANNQADKAITQSFLLNVAAGLLIRQRCQSIEEGILQTKEGLENGSFLHWLKGFQEFNQS